MALGGLGLIKKSIQYRNIEPALVQLLYGMEMNDLRAFIFSRGRMLNEVKKHAVTPAFT